MPTQQLINAKGAFGYTANEHGGRMVEVYEAGNAIAALEVVSIDTDGTVLKATTSIEPKVCVGIALEDAAAGDPVQVCTRGVVKDVPKEPGSDGIVAGDALQRSGTTAGKLIPLAVAASADRGDDVAVAIGNSDDTADTVDVYVVGIYAGNA